MDTEHYINLITTLMREYDDYKYLYEIADIIDINTNVNISSVDSTKTGIIKVNDKESDKESDSDCEDESDSEYNEIVADEIVIDETVADETVVSETVADETVVSETITNEAVANETAIDESEDDENKDDESEDDENKDDKSEYNIYFNNSYFTDKKLDINIYIIKSNTLLIDQEFLSLYLCTYLSYLDGSDDGRFDYGMIFKYTKVPIISLNRQRTIINTMILYTKLYGKLWLAPINKLYDVYIECKSLVPKNKCRRDLLYYLNYTYKSLRKDKEELKANSRFMTISDPKLGKLIF